MIYAIARLNVLGMLSLKLKRQSDTRRKRLRGASDTTNLQSSVFNSGLSGLGIYSLNTIAYRHFP
jgi:hypothetical protein